MSSRGARIGLVLALLGALGALALLITPSGGGDDLDPSSRSPGMAGTLALHDYLGALGLDVHRISGDFDVSGTDLLFVIQPLEDISDSETTAIQDRLRAGASLVLAVDPESLSPASRVLARLGINVTRAVTGVDATPPRPLDAAGTVRHVVTRGVTFGFSGDTTPLLRVGNADVLVETRVGAGRAFVLGSPYPLSNEGLRVTRPASDGGMVDTGSDAYALVLALIERSTAGSGGPMRAAFDEVHHGEGASGGAGAVVYSPVGLAALLSVLIVIAYLATSGRRLGRPVPAGDPGRVPTAADFVQAMAHLFERSVRRGSVAGRYAEEMKGTAAAVTGIDPHLDDDAFLTALASWGAERAGPLAEALARARSLAAGAPTDAQLLALSRDADEVEAIWSAGAPSAAVAIVDTPPR